MSFTHSSYGHNTFVEVSTYSTTGKILEKIFNYQAKRIFVRKDKNSISGLAGGRILFHGSQIIDLEKMLQQGIDLSLTSPQNAFGRGLYMTLDLKKALKYGNHIAVIYIMPSLKIKTYHKYSSETPSTSKEFIAHLRQLGYEAIEVYSGTRVHGWWDNGIVKAHELCVFDENAVNKKLLLLAVGVF